jgi:hypothetical protein
VVSLSISLVAIGFVGPSSPGLGPFLAIVLPTLFVLGLFTVVRLVDTGVENLRCIRAMGAIRAHYANLTPDASEYFATRADPAAQEHAVLRRGHIAGLSTTASMIATLNAVVGGTAVALVSSWLQGGISRGYALPVSVGAASGAVLLTLFFVYQARRYAALPALNGLGD